MRGVLTPLSRYHHFFILRPVSCQLLTRSLCPCVTSNTAKPRSEFLSDLASLRAGLRRGVSSPAYQDRMNAGGGTDTIILYTNFILGVLLLTGLHDLSLPSDAELGVQVAGLPPVSLLPDLSYLSPNCFHPSQKLHAKSKS